MAAVREALGRASSAREAAATSGVPYSTVVRWRAGRTAAFGRAPRRGPWRPVDPRVYAYLLGVYLGDGHIYVSRPGRALLRVHLDALYSDVVAETAEAVAAVSGRRVQLLRPPGKRMVVVQAAWRDWPLALPQHGRGRKHERPIVLEDWQREIVAEHAGLFVRGLIHSDGCRTVNRFSTRLPSGRVAEYAYPRYFFSNLSADIRGLFCEACDALGVRWTRSNARNISVSHRRSVAVLDAIVGPKT